MFGRAKQEELTKQEEEKVKAKFESFKKKSYSEDDMNNIFDNEDKIMGKMNDEKLKGFIEEVKLFFSMLKDFFTKKYTDVPIGIIMAIAGSLLYVLSPIDIIPDFIPVVGYLDDAAVITACLNFVRIDLEKYKKFKELNQVFSDRMDSHCWKTVGKRLLSLGKTVLNQAVPVVVEAAVVTAIRKACEAIESKLKKMYCKTAINSAIILALNMVGILTAIFIPFGITISRYISGFFFIGALGFSLVRFILNCRNYGRQTIQIGKHIFNKRSVSKGIGDYVLSEFPVIACSYAGIDMAGQFIPSLREIPRVDETVKIFINTFWKKLAIYMTIVAVYTISVFWVIKPILLKTFSEI